MESVPILLDPFADRTFLHPAIALFTVVLCLVAFARDRRYAIVGCLIALNFVTSPQRLYLLGVNLPIMRIFILAALLRIVVYREHVELRIVNLDKVVVLYGIVSTVAFTLQVPTLGSLSYALGNALDAVGAYFVIRCLIRNQEDVRLAVRALMGVSLVMFLLFAFEAWSGRNPFSIFGGIPGTPDVRGSRVRLQGPYPHPILAGAYWAAVLPLFISYRIREGKRDPLMYFAAAACIAIVVLSASSTPIVSVGLGLAASLLYLRRGSLQALKLGIVLLLVVLALAMRHPIWFLLARIDVVGGSTGYYRYLLLDSFIRHWSDWFLIGIRDTFAWGRDLALPWVGLRDLTNQFVYEGVRGGAASLAAFVAAVTIAFGYVGRLVRAAVSEVERRQYWQLGVSLLVHVFSFMAVSYFGQVRFSWWMTLALCASLFEASFAEKLAPRRAVAAG